MLTNATVSAATTRPPATRLHGIGSPDAARCTDVASNHTAPARPSTSTVYRGIVPWNTNKKTSSSPARKLGIEMIPNAPPLATRSNRVPLR